MSDPIDEPALDEYLNRGSAVSRRYRELDAPDVPAEIDRRVLDQARAAAVQAQPRVSRRWVRWSAPVALAASAVLVLSIVVRSGVQQTTLSPASRVSSESLMRKEQAEARQKEIAASGERKSLSGEETPTRAATGSVPQVVPIVPAEAPTPELYAQPPPGAQSATAPQNSVAATAGEEELADGPPPPAAPESETLPRVIQSGAIESGATESATVAAQREPAAADTDISEIAVTGSVRRSRGGAGPRGTITPARAEQRAQNAADGRLEHSEDPERWLEEIRALRRNGKHALADREWARFREAFPEHEVAQGDLAREQAIGQPQGQHEVSSETPPQNPPQNPR